MLSQISDGIPGVNFVGNDVFIQWEGAGTVGRKIIEFPQVQQTCGCDCPASLNPKSQQLFEDLPRSNFAGATPQFTGANLKLQQHYIGL